MQKKYNIIVIVLPNLKDFLEKTIFWTPVAPEKEAIKWSFNPLSMFKVIQSYTFCIF